MNCDLPESFAAIRWRSILLRRLLLSLLPWPPDAANGMPMFRRRRRKWLSARRSCRTVTLYHEFPGTTQASQAVSIIPRVLGYMDSLHFVDGGTSPRANCCSSSIRGPIKMPTTSRSPK